MRCEGTFRIYFNRHQAAPLVWCVALLDKNYRPAWELAVRSVRCLAPIESFYVIKTGPDGKLIDDADDGTPSGYFEASGELSVSVDGNAVISEP